MGWSSLFVGMYVLEKRSGVESSVFLWPKSIAWVVDF